MRTCGTCGRESGDDFAFCPACGSPLEAAAAPEARRTVTVLFTDIVGSTQLGERLDPERLRALLASYFEAMRRVIEGHGGTVEKFIGDAVMAVFGVPHIREDDALRAVRAAAAMGEALAELNEELRDAHGVEIQIRTGVNTGEVVVTDAASATTKLAAGDATNVAARFEQAAGPGEILIGEPTYRLVRDAVLAEPVEGLSLKGKSEHLTAYRVSKVDPEAAGFARRLDAPMVGRERELSLLQGAFERAASDDACQLFTVLGVGGVGKSRLLDAFVTSLQDRATVLRGRCLAYGDGITFLPIVEAIQRVASLTGAEEPDETRSRIGALVTDDEHASRITEQVVQVLGVAGGDVTQEETLWAIRKLIEAMARERPVVLVLDDLQWAEPTLLQLVEHIADRSVDAPILLACMARPELLDARPDWGGGKLNATSISLEPLTPDECERLVANLLAIEAVAPEIRERVARASEGLPLYAEELLAMLVEEGRLSLVDGEWTASDDLVNLSVPPTTSALLAARLDRLEPAERDVLERASVIGQVFPRDALEALVDAPGLDARLDSLMRRQFVRPERSDVPGVEALAFRHLLIRDVAYEAMTKAARADLHERFADWLGRTASERSELIGYHYERALRYLEELGPVDRRGRILADRATTHLQAAGAQAFDRGDMPAAANLLARAAGLLPPDDPAVVPILSTLSHAEAELGELAKADETIRRAIEVADQDGDELLAARARVHRAWLIQWGQFALDEYATALDDASDSLSLFERAGDLEGAAFAQAVMGQSHWQWCRAAPAGEAWRRAVDLFREAGNPFLESEYLGWLSAVCSWGPMPCDEAMVQLQALLDEVRGRPAALLEVGGAVGTVLMMLGDLGGARQRFEEYDRGMRELGRHHAYQHGAQQIGLLEILSGNPAGAEDVLGPAARELEEMGSGAVTIIAAFRSQALYALGRYDDAEEAAAIGASLGDMASGTISLGVRAMVQARRGHFDEAERLAREGIEGIDRGDFIVDQADARIALAEVLELAGRTDEAIGTAREALALYERKGNVLQAGHARDRLTRLSG